MRSRCGRRSRSGGENDRKRRSDVNSLIGIAAIPLPLQAVDQLVNLVCDLPDLSLLVARIDGHREGAVDGFVGIVGRGMDWLGDRPYGGGDVGYLAAPDSRPSKKSTCLIAILSQPEIDVSLALSCIKWE